MINAKRIEWIDGLKGIACVLIFVHHFLLMFYPASFYGKATESNFRGIDTALSQSPLGVFFNGNFLVTIFCLLSGIVISTQIMTMQEKEKLSSVVIKRYFRLMLPLLPIGLLIYALLSFGLFSNIEVAEFTNSTWAAAYYQEALTFTDTLKAIFVDVWFFGNNRLCTSFWMLSQLFYGTFLSIILSTLCWKFKKRVWIVYAILAIMLWGHSTLSVAFVLGTLLVWIHVNYPDIFNKLIGIFALLGGLFWGGYPSGVEPTNVYRIFGDAPYQDLHIIGAFLAVFGVFSLKPIQKILSAPLFKWLGKISYSFYLVHIALLFSLSAEIFMLANKYLSYSYSVLISFLISLILLIVLSWLYNKFVEAPFSKATAKIMPRILG